MSASSLSSQEWMDTRTGGVPNADTTRGGKVTVADCSARGCLDAWNEPAGLSFSRLFLASHSKSVNGIFSRLFSAR
jgi:hypothetical protein